MRVLILCLALALPACNLLGPAEPISTRPLGGVAEQAQNAVNEANLGLTAAANVIAANVKDKIWSKEQAQGYLEKVKEYAKRADSAQELINLGKFSEGKTQAEALRSLIIVLHREIAVRAREEAK